MVRSVDDEPRVFLTDCGIFTGIHFPMALLKMPAFSVLGQTESPMRSNREGDWLLSVPVGDHINIVAIDYAYENLKEFFGA